LCVDTHKENEKEMRFALIHDVGISFFFSLFLLDGPVFLFSYLINLLIMTGPSRKRQKEKEIVCQPVLWPTGYAPTRGTYKNKKKKCWGVGA